MIEFFFDCSSPWTYLGFHAIQPLVAELKEPVRWRPILVGGVFNAVNPSVYASREHPVPAKLAYLKKDLTDWARLCGLKIKMPPSIFPINSVKAMRGCVWLEPQGMLVPFATKVFEAYWGGDEDITQDAVLARLCRETGVDEQAFFAGIAQQGVKDILRANTDELIARGGYGSPTMFLDGDDMYFGNDRLPLLREAILRRRGEATTPA
ncbi:MAG: 2-hydroxychromene-2-carboxylate isomerase [Burkholderiales bacterium]